MFDLVEEDGTDEDDEEAKKAELKGEPYHLIVGASVVRDLEEANSEEDKDIKLNYAFCPGANAEKIIDYARQSVYTHYVNSSRPLKVLVVAGIGSLSAQEFDVYGLMSRIERFFEAIDSFTKFFGIKQKPQVTFSELPYPINSRYTSEVDMYNQLLHIACLKRDVEHFKLSEIFFREPKQGMSGNISVQGVEMYSPISFWRHLGSNHPSEKRLPEVDSRIRKFFKRGFKPDFQTELSVLGFETRKRKRRGSLEEKEEEKKGKWAAVVAGQAGQSEGGQSSDRTEKRTVIINPARIGEEMRKREQEEKEKKEKEERERKEQEDRNRTRNTYRGPRTANLGEFIVEDRRRGRQRYEDRGQDLTPEEIERKKKEREERFEENKRKRAEQEKERIEKAEKEKEKYKGNLVEQYKKAKSQGNRDVANRLFTMMAKFGVDLGQLD